MAADAAISRVNTVDFFAVIVPGTLMAANISLLGLAFLNPGEKAVWTRINDAIVHFHVNGVILLLLAALLLGSGARAFPVNIVDALSGWINSRLIPREKQKRASYALAFPYMKLLDDMFNGLKSHHSFSVSVSPTSEPDPHTAFNYWKTVVCKESTGLFFQVRATEARVRMFAGIIWATAVSCRISLGALVCPILQDWRQPIAASACVSFALFVVFVTLLRPMRREEVRTVYLAYLAIHS